MRKGPGKVLQEAGTVETGRGVNVRAVPWPGRCMGHVVK